MMIYCQSLGSGTIGTPMQLNHLVAGDYSWNLDAEKNGVGLSLFLQYAEKFCISLSPSWMGRQRNQHGSTIIESSIKALLICTFYIWEHSNINDLS